MTASIIINAMEQRRERGEKPRADLRLVWDAERVTAPCEPRQRIGEGFRTALNKVFAFVLLLVAIVSIGIGGYAAGNEDRVLRETLIRVAQIVEAAKSRPLLQQIGTFNREKGM